MFGVEGSGGLMVSYTQTHPQTQFSHFTLLGHTDSTCLKSAWVNETHRRADLAAAARQLLWL